MNVLLGIFNHAIGGFSSASFFMPSSKQKHWAHETYWLIQSSFSWLICPIVVAWITVPHLGNVLAAASKYDMCHTLLLGFIYGFGGFAFGLGLRYVGLALTYSVAIGISSALGTIIALRDEGRLGTILSEPSGQVALGGVLLSLVGFSVCGWAGYRKERSGQHHATNITKTFQFNKGIIAIVTAGVLSAVFLLALKKGASLGEVAVEHGTPPLFKSNVVFIFAMGGAFLNNFAWCLIDNLRKGTLGQYVAIKEQQYLGANYLLASFGGTLWYVQFFFYGMAENYMGPLSYASWAIHMTFLILFSNVWGLVLGEWRGVPRPVQLLLVAGIAILIFAITMIGFSRYLVTGGAA